VVIERGLVLTLPPADDRRDVQEICALCGIQDWRNKEMGLVPHFNERGYLKGYTCESCDLAFFRAARGGVPILGDREG